MLGVHQVDTRALVRHLRRHGALKGVVTTRGNDLDALARKAAAAPGVVGQDLVRTVSCPQPYEYARGTRCHVAVLDCGVKASILATLAGLGCRVTVLPASTPADAVRALQPDASCSPTARAIPGASRMWPRPPAPCSAKVPMLGICLGHEILALARGSKFTSSSPGTTARTTRCRTWPRVKSRSQAKTTVCSGNAGNTDAFTVRRPEREVRGVVTHRSLYDGTVEGLAFPDLRAYSFQYHPEAGPGPHDARCHFARFLERIGA